MVGLSQLEGGVSLLTSTEQKQRSCDAHTPTTIAPSKVSLVLRLGNLFIGDLCDLFLITTFGNQTIIHLYRTPITNKWHTRQLFIITMSVPSCLKCGETLLIAILIPFSHRPTYPSSSSSSTYPDHVSPSVTWLRGPPPTPAPISVLPLASSWAHEHDQRGFSR